MNSRSPRVVLMGKKPLRSIVGETNLPARSSPTSMAAIDEKKIASRGGSIPSIRESPWSLHPSGATQGKALGDMFTDEVDDQSAPGTMVSTPAAARVPQSMPAAGGPCGSWWPADWLEPSCAVRVRARSSSTQENMKQEEGGVTPMPGLESAAGRWCTKKRGKL
jgi:hypothetical protein